MSARTGDVMVWGLLVLCSCVLANGQPPTPSTGPAPGEVYTQASRVYVFVDKTGLGHQHGVEARLSSSRLVIGAASAAGELVFDMNSFDADTPAARKYVGLSGTTNADTRTAVNENMKGADILNVKRYPQAKYVVSSAKATGQTSRSGLPTFKLTGQFTLRGTTRPLTIMVEVEQDRGWLHVLGNFSIKQSDFGIKPYSKALGAIGVADPLRIYGDVYVAPSEHVVMTEIPVSK